MCRPKIISILLSSIFLWAAGCGDLTAPEGFTLPFNELELLELNNDGVVLIGEILLTGGLSVVSADLNWYATVREEFREEERFNSTVSIDASGHFTSIIDRDMLPEVNYTARVKYELSDGQRLYSNLVRFQNTALVRQPIKMLNRYDDFFGRNADAWSGDEDGIKIFDLNFAGNFDLTDAEFRQSTIVNRRLDNFDFLDSFEARFWIKQDEQYFFRTPAGGNIESLAVYDEPSDSFTRLGNVPASRRGTQAIVIGEDTYYFGTDRQVYKFSYGTELSIVQVTSEAPIPAEGLIETYLTSAGENIYLVTQQNDSPAGLGDPEVHLWELNPATGNWVALLAFPGSPHGALWFSGEPGKLILGGGDERNNFVNPGEKNVWIFDLEQMEWQMIGWFPFVNAYDHLDPIYFEGKHYFLGADAFDANESVIFTLDLRDLIDI